MKNFKKYLKIINEQTKVFPNKFSKIQTLRYYFRWKKSLRANNNPLNDESPWINFPAIDFLQKIANPTMKVFEYGSGGSTLFWARRVDKVYSIEHDKKWTEKVKEQLIKKNINNVSILHVPPVVDPASTNRKIENPNDYISDDESFHGYNFEDYVKTIDNYSENYFDVVIVDGRARPSCLLNARTKIKAGGYLLIDNTERNYYLQNTLPVLKDEKWEQHDFYGPLPYLNHFCRTTIFRKRK